MSNCLFDLSIKNCLIVSSLYNSTLPYNIYIKDDIIAQIVPNTESNTPIKYIAYPGFVDVHSHTDEGGLNPAFISKVAQGVTTEICGNCGGSPFPFFSSESVQHRSQIKQREDSWHPTYQWNDFIEYKTYGYFQKLTCNQICLLGWWSLYDEMQLSHMPFDTLFICLDYILSQGCWGLSINQSHKSWQFLDLHHKQKIASILKKHNKPLTVHLGSYSDKFIQCLNEILTIFSGLQIHISHIKFLTSNYQENIDYLLQMLNSIPNLYCDIYPYTSIFTTIDNIVEQKGYSINNFNKIIVYSIPQQTIQKTHISWTSDDENLLMSLYKRDRHMYVEAFWFFPQDILYQLYRHPKILIGSDSSSNNLQTNIGHLRSIDTFQVMYYILKNKFHWTPAQIANKLSILPLRSFSRGTFSNDICTGNIANFILLSASSKIFDLKYVIINGQISYSKSQQLFKKNGIVY